MCNPFLHPQNCLVVCLATAAAAAAVRWASLSASGRRVEKLSDPNGCESCSPLGGRESVCESVCAFVCVVCVCVCDLYKRFNHLESTSDRVGAPFSTVLLLMLPLSLSHCNDLLGHREQNWTEQIPLRVPEFNQVSEEFWKNKSSFFFSLSLSCWFSALFSGEHEVALTGISQIPF